MSKPTFYSIFLATFLLLITTLQCHSTNTLTINSYLTPHNKIRANLNLPPLKWSNQLASYAKWWARQRRGDCAMIHSGSGYGENLFWGSTGRNWGPRDAVGFWASERSYYDYNSNSCGEGRECLHYTQIVWRRSLRVGCAKVRCDNGFIFIGCNYYPQGNIYGQRPF